jgi:sugar (pentulose or hexulose) kinase
LNGNLIAVFDIGKTNAKLLLVDAGSGEPIWQRERKNQALPGGPCAQLDLPGLEDWLIDALRDAPHRGELRCIVPITHGAAIVALDADGQPLCAPDYEDPVYERDAAAYAAARDDYAQTYSPLLPLGLNLGRQLYYLQHFQPALFRDITQLLLYPQYWAWRLSGVMASEVTSLGCHTDLWRPTTAGYSVLAQRQGWSSLLPPIRGAAEKLGVLRGALQQATGLGAGCQIVCGIHDSNASYLSLLASWRQSESFAVISSGTWVVIFAQGTPLSALRERADMLANVDAAARPVATARFMGGREFEAIAGPDGVAASGAADEAAIRHVIAQQALAVPAFASGGPYAGHPGALRNASGLSAVQRAALASLYLALMCDLRLDDLDSHQPVLIDGPLAANPLFAPLLAALRPHAPVYLADRRSGVIRGALRLAQPGLNFEPPAAPTAPLAIAELQGYRALWRGSLPGT